MCFLTEGLAEDGEEAVTLLSPCCSTSLSWTQDLGLTWIQEETTCPVAGLGRLEWILEVDSKFKYEKFRFFFFFRMKECTIRVLLEIVEELQKSIQNVPGKGGFSLLFSPWPTSNLWHYSDHSLYLTCASLEIHNISIIISYLQKCNNFIFDRLDWMSV